MAAVLDPSAITAAFDMPQPNGEFQGVTRAYLEKLGLSRRIVLMAFAPKAAGTFLRQAVIDAIGGYLHRGAHAQGGRDGSLYLPFLIAALLERDKTAPVIHVHMQALPANRNFIRALGLKPAIMLRPVPDMLASYRDMLDSDPVARADGLNCLIPANWLDLSDDAKSDFLVDVMAPWYASYFATWKSFADADPGRVLVLHYDAFRANPAETLDAVLRHAGYVIGRERREAALNGVAARKTELRFNKGQKGRGGAYFSPEQKARIARLLSHYDQLRPWLAELTGETALDHVAAA